MKNLLKLHEAISVALLDKKDRKSSFEEIALFIEKRNLYPIRKNNISLATQIMLRTTKSKNQYHYLFEQLDEKTIRLRSLDK